MSEPINNCPFCGSDEVVVVEAETDHAVECIDCRARGPLAIYKPQAIVEWNEARPHD
jgi:Lar family restriction alleviation protein